MLIGISATTIEVQSLLIQPKSLKGKTLILVQIKKRCNIKPIKKAVLLFIMIFFISIQIRKPKISELQWES